MKTKRSKQKSSSQSLSQLVVLWHGLVTGNLEQVVLVKSLHLGSQSACLSVVVADISSEKKRKNSSLIGETEM